MDKKTKKYTNDDIEDIKEDFEPSMDDLPFDE